MPQLRERLLIYQLIEQIPQENALAVALNNLVENFQFDRVTELAQPIEEYSKLK
jgi:hypothetical protein